MTTNNYINDNKTIALKKGDKVVMHTCGESDFPKYKGKLWTCTTDSYLDKSKQEVVFLDGFSGCFCVEYLQIVNLVEHLKPEQKDGEIPMIGHHKLPDEHYLNIDNDEQKEEGDNDKLYTVMQYYMEHCLNKEYVTPKEWIEKHKHF